MHSVLLAIPNLAVVPHDGSLLDKIAHQTYVQFAVAGFPAGGFRITLIGLLIIVILAIAVNGITEKLTGAKVGSVTAAVIVTIVGSAIAAAYVLLPFDFELEGIRIIAALLGAVVIAVFWSLLRKSAKGSGGGGGGGGGGH